MTMKKWSDGDILYAADQNGMFAESLTLSLFSLCRELEAGTVTFSAGYVDSWGDAYTSSGGRFGSVSVSEAAFSSNKYIATGDMIQSSWDNSQAIGISDIHRVQRIYEQNRFTGG
jgi:hypothetical protein